MKSPQLVTFVAIMIMKKNINLIIIPYAFGKQLVSCLINIIRHMINQIIHVKDKGFNMTWGKKDTK